MMVCHRLADVNLTAANLNTLRQQLAVLTMLLGPVSLRMELLMKM